MNEIQVKVFFWFLAFAALQYAAAVSISFFRLRKTGLSEGPWFAAFSVSGFLTHTVSLVCAASYMGRLPLANSYELMESVAWALMFANILSMPFLKAKIAPTLAALTACALTVLPLFCPAFSDGVAKADALNVNYAALHALLAVSSYAALGFSFVFSLMYILQVRSLKAKDAGAFSRALLPLPRLVSFAKFFLCAACFLMALSLLVGIAAAFGLQIGPAYVIKFSIGALLFLLMLGLLAFSARKNFDASAFSKLNVLLFLSAVVLIVPISIRSFI